jgi:predicted DsbA family dithiol-disulfide isomerase
VSAKVRIEIWSDVMCPWCLIGWHQLQKGLALVADEIEAEISWRPFELNPAMPPEGEPQQAHVMRKYGRSAEEAAFGRVQMQRVASDAGANLGWTGANDHAGDAPPAMMWNTLAAHCLLTHAREVYGAAVQTRLKLALFAAHFNQRRNVADAAVLVDLAREVGMDPAAAAAALADPALKHRVGEEERLAWDMNITGVPAMVVNGKFLIPGAQEPEVYANTLRRVVARAL